MKDYEKSAYDYKGPLYININKDFIHYICPKNFVMLMHLMFAMIFRNLRKNLEIKFDPLTFCEFNTLVY